MRSPVRRSNSTAALAASRPSACGRAAREGVALDRPLLDLREAQLDQAPDHVAPEALSRNGRREAFGVPQGPDRGRLLRVPAATAPGSRASVVGRNDRCLARGVGLAAHHRLQPDDARLEQPAHGAGRDVGSDVDVSPRAPRPRRAIWRRSTGPFSRSSSRIASSTGWSSGSSRIGTLRGIGGVFGQAPPSCRCGPALWRQRRRDHVAAPAR